MNQVTEKKIRFGETEFKVQNVYPYRYQSGKGKEVLHIDTNEEYVDDASLKLLKTNTGDIEHYERDIITEDDGTVISEGEWRLVRTYENYINGEYMSTYENGNYTCEVGKLTTYDVKLEQVQADTDFALSLLGAI